MFLNKKLTVLFCLAVFFMVSCSEKKNDTQEIDAYVEKIQNQKVKLDDAIRQLKDERKQVKLLQNRLDITKEDLEKAKKNRKVIRVNQGGNNQKMLSEYKQMKADVDKWREMLDRKQEEYKKIQKELDKVLDYMADNEIELVRNKLGEIEGLVIGKSKAEKHQFDSLMTVIKREREFSAKSIRNFKRLVGGYKKEITKWQGRFNESGIFLKDARSNFIVKLDVDTATNATAKYSMNIIRQIGKPASGELEVRMICKLPDGNQFDLYSNTVPYGKKEENITINGIRPYEVRVSGVHKIIVSLNGKEAYYEDIMLTK